jgi:hypothetical protein
VSTKRTPAPRRRKTAATKPSRRRKPPAPEVEAFEDAVDESLAPLEPPPLPAVVVEHEPEVQLSIPDPSFAARVPPPAPDRPHPDHRRAIFFDVENTSRAEHVARVIEHLAVDRRASRTEFIAVGNWRVIGHDTARLLARHGAQLVHSAPSVGVRDWSDLRIAVTAGVWLASARAGDVIELVSDDRAFDAVGDVAATLGITFRRLSFRRLAGMRTEGAAVEAPAPAPQRHDEARDGGRGRRRGRRGGRERDRDRGRDRDRDRHRQPHVPAPAPHPVPHAAPTGAEVAAVTNGEPAVEPHTAPHDEIVSVVRELIDRSRDNAVSIDTLANALKSRGFRRPPGSPRLITRLRRIREITIDRTGRITLVGASGGGHPRAEESGDERATPAAPDERGDALEGHDEEPEGREDAPAGREQPAASAPHEDDDDRESIGNRRRPGEPDTRFGRTPAGDYYETADDPTPGNEITGGPGREPPGDVKPQPRRRRSRRGGRGRRHGRSGAAAAP